MLKLTLFQNTLQQYLYFVATILIGIVVAIVSRRIIIKRLKVLAKTTRTDVDEFAVELLDTLIFPLACYGIFYIASRYLTLSSGLNQAIKFCGIAFLTIQVIRFLAAVLGYVVEKYWLKQGKSSNGGVKNLKTLLSVLKVIIWGIGIVFLLDNLGFKISAVLAGLGIGGVAVALAAQTILGDLFSYFAIFFDKPFEIGDFIVVDDFLGTIEHIGIKTTRIRSLGGEQIIFSNSNLTNARVRNYKRMDMRRVVFKIGVTYQTPLEQLKEIPVLIKNIIANVGGTSFDRTHFFSFGDFSLVFEIVYYVLSQDYNKYMDIQQEINFFIREEFEKRGIEFAFPTQTLYIDK